MFDVDFSQEFSIEKKMKKEAKSRKRPLENDIDEMEEDDDMETGDMVDADEDEELEDWSEEAVEVKINIKSNLFTTANKWYLVMQ